MAPQRNYHRAPEAVEVADVKLRITLLKAVSAMPETRERL